MIPDLSGGKPATNNTGCVCSSNFYAGYGNYGAFYSNFGNLSSSASATFGSRLAKW